ncbi:MAG: hypothetical protein PVI99_01240 [Anaerolineales bacterium]|jgi:hypothetical protein
MKFFQTRLGQILFGVLILGVAAVGFYFVAQAMLPQTYQVVVALRDIQKGEPLTPDAASYIEVQLADPSLYILTEEISEFGYHPTARFLSAGEFVPKSAISMQASPESGSRLSLSLEDPDLVAMRVFVTEENFPEAIANGDYVDINVSIGAATFLTGPIVPEPTARPYDPVENFTITAGEDGELVTEYIEPSPTPTPGRTYMLPVTKTVYHGARVLNVIYNIEYNPDTSEDAEAFIRGAVSAVDVAVPREIQEAVAFALNNGMVNLAVLDPNFNPDHTVSPGVSYDDFAEFFDAQRVFWLQTPVGEEPGDMNMPGAGSISETMIAPYVDEE